MDYLWTPWRYEYISASGDQRECVFCAAAKAPVGVDSLVAYRAEWNFVILNRYPYTNGHLMVVPYQHAASLGELRDEALVEMIRLGRDAELHLREIYRPEGLNLGLNLGRSAGAGVAGHVHLHALPRWTGDVSFMTAVGETRVLPEDLAVTWEKLSRAFQGA
jgi:ATP adenylyltransferase